MTSEQEGLAFMRFWIAALLAAGLVAGCSGPQLRSNEHVTVSDTGVLPPPTRQDLGGQTRASVIGPFDRVSVEVYGVEDLSRTVQVDAGGRMALPLVGDIEAAGMTVTELAALIRQRLAGLVRDPQVTVNMVEAVSQTVTIEGEVEEPGIYPVVGRMTLMRVVARAKGATEFARLSHVVLFRRVEGRQMAALYDLRAIRAGLYADPEIYPNDVVVVGESQARRLFRDVLQGSSLLTTPIIALLQNNN
jgi:polysaccharide export outer membrane protein